MNIIYDSLKVFEDANPQISQKIRADERANIVEKINKAEDKLVGCYKSPKDIMTIRMAFAELREDIGNNTK